jgi:hypothetical protein
MNVKTGFALCPRSSLKCSAHWPNRMNKKKQLTGISGAQMSYADSSSEEESPCACGNPVHGGCKSSFCENSWCEQCETRKSQECDGCRDLRCLACSEDDEICDACGNRYCDGCASAESWQECHASGCLKRACRRSFGRGERCLYSFNHWKWCECGDVFCDDHNPFSDQEETCRAYVGFCDGCRDVLFQERQISRPFVARVRRKQS